MIRAFPKPLKFPAIETKRLPERKPMTIALAFTSEPGVVLCSDTQMTSDSGFKFEESKLLSAREANTWGLFGIYAGDPELAHSVERQLTTLYSEVEEAPTDEEFEQQLEKIVTRVCRKRRGQLVMYWAFSTQIYVRLFRVSQKTITDVVDFDCFGVGDSSLVRFLADNLRIVRTQDAARAASYIVRQAIKYIEGVGGSVETWAIYKSGRIETIGTSKLPRGARPIPKRLIRT